MWCYGYVLAIVGGGAGGGGRGGGFSALRITRSGLSAFLVLYINSNQINQSSISQSNRINVVNKGNTTVLCWRTHTHTQTHAIGWLATVTGNAGKVHQAVGGWGGG